jgi:hypothetical protein
MSEFTFRISEFTFRISEFTFRISEFTLRALTSPSKAVAITLRVAEFTPLGRRRDWTPCVVNRILCR